MVTVVFLSVAPVFVNWPLSDSRATSYSWNPPGLVTTVIGVSFEVSIVAGSCDT